uniref:Cytochrome c oxidase subunit 3 n=1 Tax=Vorticeros sp. n. MW-2019 TaxID=2544881 RepID=A0AA49X8N2_9PLAT|nr:cytochrome c oxidase subunit III [Vorticeros sp. n. MW-2019]
MSINTQNFVPYHLVDISPWPFLTSLSVLGITFGGVFWWHYGSFLVLVVGFSITLWLSANWWTDVSNESSLGWHSSYVITGLQLGMLLFILSEVFFFFSFFWSYFHNCWSSVDELGWVWPPYGFNSVLVDPFSIPLLNTIILLTSGVTVTWCHHSLLQESYSESVISLFLTCCLGGFFLFMQVLEYSLSYFSINSTSYGTVFFLLTGFHGMHVIVGTIFLSVCLFRLIIYDFNNTHHVGFESAAWYWHFVDVVWLFLFFFVYWYGFLL